MARFINRTNANTLLSAIITCAIVAIGTIVFPTVAQAADEANQAPTIIGGEEAENIYPWTVALVKIGSKSTTERQFCGGTLIDSEWVLTAAHCVYRSGRMRSPSSFNIVLGVSHLSSGQGEEVKIAKVIPHPEYDTETNNMDIALLRLERSVSYPTIEMGNAALLDEQAQTQLLTLGWGTTEYVERSDVLLQVNVPFVDAETCNSVYTAYGYAILDGMICAGYAEGGKDACSGDSGGPLVAPAEYNAAGEVQEWVLVGVVSWGAGCARANAYGVYADVGFIADWATEQIENYEIVEVIANVETEEVESYSVAPEVISAQASKTVVFLPFIQ